MPKCLECGFEASRLQWTHFRYKCTGRFKNGEEYKKVYPNAELVDDELKKRTAVTLETLTKKYGPEEGAVRWQEYKNKQAYSNSLEYKQARHGWTEEEYDLFNKGRAVTIDNLIKKHGVELGTEKWIAYCERQAYTNTKEYFVEQMGAEAGTAFYLELNKKKAVYSVEKLMETRGISFDEANGIILARIASRPYGSSMIEIDFINKLAERVGTLDHDHDNPYGMWSHALGRYTVFDVVHSDCVIEFNGTYWHADPRFYKGDAIIRGNSASDIWEKDRLKLQTAIDRGFRVNVVWEEDYRKNPIMEVERIVKWMLNE